MRVLGPGLANEGGVRGLPLDMTTMIECYLFLLWSGCAEYIDCCSCSCSCASSRDYPDQHCYYYCYYRYCYLLPLPNTAATITASADVLLRPIRHGYYDDGDDDYYYYLLLPLRQKNATATKSINHSENESWT